MNDSVGSDGGLSFERQKKIFKIIVLGDSNVGKTCLTCRFCTGTFPTKPEATIGVDFRERQVVVDNEPITLQLWDTAGQERFRKSMIPHYYRNVHGVVFVYDVTKIGSFRNLSHWIGEYHNYQGDQADIPQILVGNKCDQLDKKAVTTSMAQKFADSCNMPLFETSASDDKDTIHVEGIFMTLAHKLKNKRPMMNVRTASDAGTITLKAASNDKADENCCC